MTNAVSVSVVVASFGGVTVLERCLDALAPALRSDTELLVATDLDASAVSSLAGLHPHARFLHADEPSDAPTTLRETRVFRLRALGVAAARGDVVALTEDHCTVPPGWVDAHTAAHDTPGLVVGGPVDAPPGTDTYGFALYLAEYAALMPPLPAGPIPYVSAVNASYRRDALQSVRSVWEQGFFDNEVHDALVARGQHLDLVSAATVTSALRFPFTGALGHLLTGGARFGGYRRAVSTPRERLRWIITLPAVPFVLLGRVVRGVARRRPDRLGRLVAGSPWLLAFVLAWSLGEARGLLGRAPPPATPP